MDDLKCILEESKSSFDYFFKDLGDSVSTGGGCGDDKKKL